MKEPYFINLYSDLLQITGDVCSAQILELFEKWTLTRFEEGDKDLWLYTGIVNIKRSVYGDFARNRIIRCLGDLHQKGFRFIPNCTTLTKVILWKTKTKTKLKT